MMFLALVLACLTQTAPAANDAAAEAESAEFDVDSAGRGEATFLLPAGPRTIRALEVVPTPATADAWRDARLRLSWEDDDPWTAGTAVDLPLGLAFGRGPGLPPVESATLGTAGQAWVNRFPMPYRTRALLRISAEGRVQGRIRLRTTRGASGDAGYFWGAALSTGSLRDSAPGAIGTRGQGRLAGLFLTTDETAIGETGRLVLDGKPGGTLAAVLGLSDDRGRSVRFERGATRGVIVSEREAGRTASGTAAYRWFLTDPVVFHESLSVCLDAGSNGASRSVVAFWYAENPAPAARP